MSANRKQSSRKVAQLAAATLTDDKASKVKKSLAASVLSQASTGKQTGANLENLASRVLKSRKYSDDTKTFAASVVSQSNKER